MSSLMMCSLTRSEALGAHLCRARRWTMMVLLYEEVAYQRCSSESSRFTRQDQLTIAEGILCRYPHAWWCAAGLRRS